MVWAIISIAFIISSISTAYHFLSKNDRKK